MLFAIINVPKGLIRKSTAIFHALFSAFKYCSFQSCIDAVASVVLLSSTLTIKDPYQVRNTGILGSLECRLWNTQFLMWSLFIASTYHMIIMTVENVQDWNKHSSRVKFCVLWTFFLRPRYGHYCTLATPLLWLCMHITRGAVKAPTSCLT